MNSRTWLKLAEQHQAIAVIRAPQFLWGQQMATAVAAGGMKLIEITWDSDRAADLISQLRVELPGCTIGTGTIVTTDQLKDAIAAGAEFAFSPHTNLDLIAFAVAHEIPIIPGALTPTEIVTAWHAGASSVKVFPVQAVGGAEYIRALHQPLRHIPLIPTGGVTPDNAKRLIEAGAIAVGLSGSLFSSLFSNRGNTALGNSQDITAHDWSHIHHQAQTLVERLRLPSMAIFPDVEKIDVDSA
ncbi:bifunctional 4-hydroxy-2-oxoglutarate aldolase/2-dehydro-3-deoxy-phosphogluconate aldolase [Myxacorys almedinensis]|uniref:Bifunctional 4-hydroxy-2-oxoglutarate aldolase/2-dehydro-3-deoxy-phosphogluconate aldolase n=1 Tax=Myxacorys almedinensis A TaxID=2690445 RepID=A0A8J7Z0F3_9CYAN|nr:bifunctional 4-hydroxy-2-oxoglutarate aldolase/2-dehydro-3-deoxy-phosphogluconate aldolase [Myxacorys almedinensis]NDJ17424.1 bifunctional 4-hydroxy-2-oxoglutarate aldolase/2-dehydro-3-deoxy-phosphogluconate aldolase [Myxacorys almedinensis A]